MIIFHPWYLYNFFLSNCIDKYFQNNFKIIIAAVVLFFKFLKISIHDIRYHYGISGKVYFFRFMSLFLFSTPLILMSMWPLSKSRFYFNFTYVSLLLTPVSTSFYPFLFPIQFSRVDHTHLYVYITGCVHYVYCMKEYIPGLSL